MKTTEAIEKLLADGHSIKRVALDDGLVGYEVARDASEQWHGTLLVEDRTKKSLMPQSAKRVTKILGGGS